MKHKYKIPLMLSSDVQPNFIQLTTWSSTGYSYQASQSLNDQNRLWPEKELPETLLAMGYELIRCPPDSYLFNNQSSVLGQILIATANYTVKFPMIF